MFRQSAESLIDTTVQEQFASEGLVSVQIERGTDFDGDPIFTVRVIVNNGGRTIDPQKTTSLTRQVRANLAEIGETSFPVFSFISNDDFS
ncbi:hypothetical protein [Roseibium litorale]|uniref:AcrB/AcrD/AcrF family protein n=1 Tax=Roseibium litorale TaxID=2803841 RepID=A0ABR9CT42_9HYPH|nr:hypothetical protein [Roseibium litorale]MBD8894051.1 hypothetical protein [Roseibium litorale]